MERTDRSSVSVLTPVNEAVEVTKKILFQPFEMGRWFAIGFCAWLANLGSGGGGNFNLPRHGGQQSGSPGMPQIPPEMWPLIIGAVIAVFILLIALSVLFLWLRSRGKFMFIHCIALNRAEVKEPWRRYGKEGNSLFFFSLKWGIAFFLGVVLTIGLGFAVAWPDIASKNFGPFSIIGITLGVVFLLSLTSVWALFVQYLNDFVVPLMYIRGFSAREAFDEFYGLFRSFPGKFLLYFLFRIVLGIGIAAVACLATCITCCLAALPYIGTVLLLPVFVFTRAYALCYFRQYGSSFDVWSVPSGDALPSAEVS